MILPQIHWLKPIYQVFLLTVFFVFIVFPLLELAEFLLAGETAELVAVTLIEFGLSNL